MSKEIKIIGITGSLRKNSVNRQLLHIAKDLLPENVKFEEVDIQNIPLFNQDLEFPVLESVDLLRKQVDEADGIIFATPEYNGSYPGVLKNVIDWLSRPVAQETMHKVLPGKTAYIVGGSAGMSGTITAQEHLRSTLAYMGVYVLPAQRATIPSLLSNVNEQGQLELNDVSTKFLQEGLQIFTDYTANLKRE